MFDSLSSNLAKIFDKLTGVAYLKEEDIDAALREIRVALLEADVSISVVKEISRLIKERAVGEKVLSSITPGQMVIKIVQDCIQEILSTGDNELNLAAAAPVVILVAGLQGSGKTTTTGKLAYKLKQSGKEVCLASLDIYRPAAQQQLEVLAKSIGVKCLAPSDNKNPLEITKNAIELARFSDVLILDTAGRMHVEQDLMNELKEIKNLSKPTETLLVADSMTGQDSVNIAKAFNEAVGITGIILTRVDSDARGGAALSMSFVTQCPIKFMGVGEKISDLEKFHPDRVASRILGMGDIVSLVEKAQEVMDKSESEALMKKMQKGNFDLNTFADQMRNMKKMGGIASIVKMIPGVNKLTSGMEGHINEDIITKQLAIISSMTPLERRNPKVLNASRKIRIAKGSGTTVQDINKLAKQFLQMQKMFKRFNPQNAQAMMRSGGMDKFFGN